MAKIKRESYELDVERKIITGLITSDKYIKEIQPMMNVSLFETPFSKMVAAWCMDYYKQFSSAPKSTIKDLYKSYSSSKKADEDLVDSIQEFLSSLSDDYTEEINVPYELSLAENYFKTKNLEVLTANIKTSISRNDILKAENHIANFKRIQKTKSDGVDVFGDNEAIVSAYDTEDEVLFKFPGDLGELVQDLCREDFFAITAPMKRGKTWWLEFCATSALMNKLKVLFVSLEMPRNQMLRRIYQSYLGEIRKNEERVLEMPFFNKNNEIEYREVTKTGTTSHKALKKAKALTRVIGENKFRLNCFPAYSASVADIRLIIENYAHYDNFVPDVVIVDYADILAPESDSPKEYRHRIDHTWKSLRALAQSKSFPCLVITASQSTRATLSKDIDPEDMAEDIRKLAHVSGMMALNQSKEDKKKNIMRVSMLAQRHEDFHTDNEVIVLQQLSIGKPYIDSRWKKSVNNL